MQLALGSLLRQQFLPIAQKTPTGGLSLAGCFCLAYYSLSLSFLSLPVKTLSGKPVSLSLLTATSSPRSGRYMARRL